MSERMAFSVDTHLLRELGALLVGRDSTALLEMIKNGYDADAESVLVHGSDLGSPHGFITVSDNGNGMTFERFRSAFLRIAGRDKEGGSRTSARYKRRYTGAKGVGRLAAHKLSARLEVTSTPRADVYPPAPGEQLTGVHADLQWDRMEHERNDLTDLGDTLTADRVPVTDNMFTGTELLLSDLRETWGTARTSAFIEEIRACNVPAVLIDPLPEAVLDEGLLFETPTYRQRGENDPGFELELTGDFAGGDDLWQTLATRADWVVEIDASASGVRYAVGPTARVKNKIKFPGDPSWAHRYEFTGPHPNPKDGPFFHARILCMEGTLGGIRTDAGRFNRRASGIRVYLEGFRVVPYGSPGDDWLHLDRDTVNRRRELSIHETINTEQLTSLDKEGFRSLGNRQYYGGVFLTEEGVRTLQALVNREGFVPDDSYRLLVDLTRSGIDLLTRVRTALARRIDKAKEDEEERRRAQQQADAQAALAGAESDDNPAGDDDGDDDGDGPGPASPDGNHEADEENVNGDGDDSEPGGPDEDAEPETGSRFEKHLLSLLQDAQNAAATARSGGATSLQANSTVVTVALDRIGSQLQRAHDEQVELRTLASVGTQYTAFVHEVNGLLGQAQTLRKLVDLFPTESFTPEQRDAIRSVRQAADELVQSLTRQASYLTDVVGPDARRRRRRLLVRERAESALRFLGPRMTQRGQHLEVDIADDLHAPPVFPAEISIILTNLLSNAAKFAGPDGRIRVGAELDPQMRLHIRVDNTGEQVKQQDWDRFFRPFESTTTDVDVVLGQGMGLGLPIVRSVAEDYDGKATFVTPLPGYSTAVEVVIPDPRPAVARRRGR